MLAHSFRFQSEVMLRKEQRAAELIAFREKTMRVMETFDLNPRRDTAARQGQFLAKNAISISMTNFALAFPLNLHAHSGKAGGVNVISATKALLLSIKTFKFATQEGEIGQASTKSFCLQFVSRYFK